VVTAKTHDYTLCDASRHMYCFGSSRYAGNRRYSGRIGRAFSISHDWSWLGEPPSTAVRQVRR